MFELLASYGLNVEGGRCEDTLRIFPVKIASNVDVVAPVSGMNGVPRIPCDFADFRWEARVCVFWFPTRGRFGSTEDGEWSDGLGVGGFPDDGSTPFGISEVVFGNLGFELSLALGADPVVVVVAVDEFAMCWYKQCVVLIVVG